MSIGTKTKKYLEETTIPLRLSCISDSGWPVVLSLWFLLDGEYLYCATPQKAHVVRYLRAQPRCGFEVASDMPPYCGIRGTALATIHEGRGLEILGKLCERYLGDRDNPLARRLLTREEPEVAICIAPQKIHVWNFTDRMKSSLGRLPDKPCPS